MRCVIQRAAEASVRVDEREVARVGLGLVVLVGIVADDADADLEWTADKLAGLRIFADEDGKMNRSALDVGGAILLVPNFTLAGDARKGRRPSFDQAMHPDRAAPMFERLGTLLAGAGLRVERGVFRAHMRVAIVNDGPVTILLDSKDALRERPTPPG